MFSRRQDRLLRRRADQAWWLVAALAAMVRSPACTDSYRSEKDSAEWIPDSVESDVRKILDVRRGEFPDALLDENHGCA